MKKITRDIACALIESSDGKILMGRKDPNGGGVYPNCWHIPGGGVEVGESLIETLQREVREEVGLDVTGESVELIDDKGSGEAVKRLESGEEVLCVMKFFVYRIEVKVSACEVSLKPGDDFIECKWFRKTSLPVDELVPAGVALFERLGYL